jgi:hypothetical protein
VRLHSDTVKRGIWIIAGIASALLYFLGLEFLPGGGFAFTVMGVILLLIALARGMQLPLMLRVFMTANVFYWGYVTCLFGRTMAPGLTGHTVGSALAIFAMVGIWPAIVLFRLWRRSPATWLTCALVPIAFCMAALVAGVEEYLFVRKYQDTGVGTTARWTVSQHWLSYDRQTKRLNGSD